MVKKTAIKKIIVGNWKMNPDTPEEAKRIFSGIKKGAAKAQKVKVVLCPPFLYVQQLVKLAKGSKISIGVQDVYQKNEGSFTGAVSSKMAAKNGAGYAIIGHSERREMGETSEIIKMKFKNVLEQGIMPILCVGEKTRDSHGSYLETVRAQIKDVLSGIDRADIGKVVIAYEPVWAIGAKEAMQPNQIHEMMIFVRKVLLEKYSPEDIKGVRVLYGGSVGGGNAQAILTEGEVDGLLIGRQSLDPKDFNDIISFANEI